MRKGFCEVPIELRTAKTIKEAMTPFDSLKWVRPGDDLSNVLQVLTTENVNQLLVIDNGNIVGMVGRDTLLSFIHLRGELGM